MPPPRSRGRGSRRRSSDRGVYIEHLPDAAGASFRGLPQCEEEQHVGGTTEPASAQKLQEQDVSFSKELPNSTTLDKSSISATFSSSPLPGSPFWARLRRDWGLKFYIRADRGGSFHTYPHVGGPFQSLQEADKAIRRHLRDRRDPKMCMGQAEISPMEMTIQTCLYWPDGTRKKRSKSNVIEKCRNDTHQFVQALVDNYNEDHNLSGDLAYELQDVVHYQYIYEDHRLYHHFNFTAKTKGADDSDCGINNLFFAEVKQTQQREHEEFVVSCFCMVKPTDNGHCYGCTNNGSVDMKHPNKADAFTGGHLDICLPLGYKRDWSDSDDDVQAEANRIRRMYKGLHDPDFVKKHFTLRPGVTPKCKTKNGTRRME